MYREMCEITYEFPSSFIFAEISYSNERRELNDFILAPDLWELSWRQWQKYCQQNEEHEKICLFKTGRMHGQCQCGKRSSGRGGRMPDGGSTQTIDHDNILLFLIDCGIFPR